MQSLNVSKLLVAAVVMAIVASVSRAGTLYFDTNGATAGIGGTGAWDTSTTSDWSTDPAGAATTGAWNQTGGQDIGVFGGTAGTVTVSGTVSANQIIFNTNSYVIQGGTINLTGSALINAGSGTIAPTISSTITGSNGLTMNAGLGMRLVLTGANTYSGTTTVGVGNLDVASNGALSSGNLLVDNAGIRIYITSNITTTATAAGLSGTGQISGIGASTTANAGTLTLSRNDGGTSTFTGMLFSTPFNLTKSGNYTQILGGTTNANSNAGKITVTGGTLALAKNAGVDAIGASVPITLTGGTLRLDNSNQINDTATMALSGGTFNLNGKSETLGALSVTANSDLDFGTAAGNSTVLFSNDTRTGGTLFVDNWDGGFIPGGGGNDKFEVTALPSATVLANIQFTASSFFPLGFLKGARAINDGSFFEIVPLIPEPTSVTLLGVGGLMLLKRRRVA